MKNVREATFSTSLKGFFSQWLRITKPFHNLSPNEQRVLSLFLYHHYQIRKDVKSSKLLWKLVFDYDTKLKIKEELGMQDYALQNLMSSLRKKGAIKNNQINPNYMPVLSDEDVKNFKIIFNIKINDK